MAYISNPGATLTFAAGSKTVNVAGTNPILEDVRAGDLALDPNGVPLALDARNATTLTLKRNAPTSGTVTFEIMWGPSRSLVAQATATTREVWAQITAWADRGLSIPVIAQQNAPPSTPADGDRYLVGTAGSGAWAGRNNQFATWSATAAGWLFTPPSAGWAATINGTTTLYVFSGTAWGSVSVNASDLSAGTVPNARFPTRLQENGTLVTDWNSTIGSGFYRGARGIDGVLNTPDGPSGTAYWHGYVIAYDSWARQFVWDLSSTGSGTRAFTRIYQPGVGFSAWERAMTTRAEADGLYFNASNLSGGTVPDARFPGRLNGDVVTNWDLAVKPGFYSSDRGVSGVLNTPDGAGGTSYWLGHVIAFSDGNWSRQMLYEIAGTGTALSIWMRRRSGTSSWSAWERVRMGEAELDARYGRLGAANVWTTTQTVAPPVGAAIFDIAAQQAGATGWLSIRGQGRGFLVDGFDIFHQADGFAGMSNRANADFAIFARGGEALRIGTGRHATFGGNILAGTIGSSNGTAGGGSFTLGTGLNAVIGATSTALLTINQAGYSSVDAWGTQWYFKGAVHVGTGWFLSNGSTYAYEQGTGSVATRYSDFNTHLWRTGAGTTMASLSSGTFEIVKDVAGTVGPVFRLANNGGAVGDAYHYEWWSANSRRGYLSTIVQNSPFQVNWNWGNDVYGTLMTLDQFGKLGLGVTPSYKLHILTPDGAYSAFFTGASTAIRMIPSASAYTIEATNQAQSAYRPLIIGGESIFFTASGVQRAFADGSAWTFQGGIRIAAYGAGTLVTDASGNISASSDVDLKTNIVPWEKGLDAVLELDPIEFNWGPNSRFDRLNRYQGFSAQDVEKVLPEAVGMDQDGNLTLNDRVIIAALVNTIKELHARLYALENS